jgi:xylosylprotein 4-beta-galactosyltransferase
MITLMIRLQRDTEQPLNHEGNAETEKLGSETLSHGHKMAILVPFRDRFEELLEFVPYMHNFLNKQGTAHQIYVINQVDDYRYVSTTGKTLLYSVFT